MSFINNNKGLSRAVRLPAHSSNVSSGVLCAKLWKRWRTVVFTAFALTGTALVIGQAGIPAVPLAIPPVNLATDPLFAATAGDKPTMALALSVEFPTVGAQYLDADYSTAKEYLGYYDAESCYIYNNTPTETPAPGLTNADYKRFDRKGPATNRRCDDSFSGNFLNWSTSSAIDMLRVALSGGDRYIDTPNLTILQRAVIPNGDPSCFWNTGNFPAKRLPRNTANGPYWGAVPTAMITQAAGSDIYVANTLNQIYFGTSATGNCGNTGAYVLGTPQPVAGTVLAQTYGPGARPIGFPANPTCNNGSSCGSPGLNEILFGRSNGGDGLKWVSYITSGAVTCNSTNFPLGSTNGNAQCYVRAYTGPIQPPAAPTALTSDAFFYSRVQVCNKAAGNLVDVRDYGLCTLYPNGNYKPTGSIQKYSDQLRLAAFGYLMDQSRSSSGGRYGGVLRAPMKFVGSKVFNEAGLDITPPGGNPSAEWNAETGVFVSNPDADNTQTVPISGVINYLNKFGRTGQVAGRYKIFDAVGEMYGETLRYLQGMEPTAEAISGITPAMSDGFPVYTNWTDPYGGSRTSAGKYSCLKSNIVVIGDVNTHDSDRIMKRTANIAANLPNFNTWQGIVNSFESNASVNYVDGQDVTRTTGNPNPANNQSQTVASGSQVLTGQAYWAHTQDIRGKYWTEGSGLSKQRPGLRTKSFFFDVNENGASTNVDYRRNRNQFAIASKYGGFETDSSNVGGRPFNEFGNPFKRQDGTNDNNVWQDPNNPGEAGTFYLQSSARNVLTAFDNIFSRASTAARSIAAAAITGESITAGTSVYQAAFDTSNWSGDVISIPLVLNTPTLSVSIGATDTWSAAARFNAMATPAITRNIVVARPGEATVPRATAFTWAAIAGTALQTQLNNPAPGLTDTRGEDRLNFIRGNRSLEGTVFRKRGNLLGDIVNSGVAYSGAPAIGLGPSASYPAFYTATVGRIPAVFAGANDGMLHAFNAATGDELFGFIPSWMGPKLAALTNLNYIANHQSYVDATPAVGEAQTGYAGTAADWKTVLVSGTGAGGHGVFALDVTNPAAFSASKVMWEFTRADDRDMGYVVGRPQILKLRTSAPNTPPVYRWFAVVASGVNNYVADNGVTTPSDTGKPALFLLALDKQANTAWTTGSSVANYYKISFPIDATLSLTRATGLINFQPTFGSAGEVAQIFTGDLHGNVWKLDFTTRGVADWTIEKLSAYKRGTAPGVIPYPLFTAKSAAGAVQPITAAPTIVGGPLDGGLATSFVAFGTGKYLETADRSSVTQQTLYSIYDDGTADPDVTPKSSALAIVSSRARLQTGTASITGSIGTVTVPAFIPGRPASNTDMSKRSGWFIDMPTTGERQVNTMRFVAGKLRFASLIPAASTAAGTCDRPNGSSNLYTLDVTTGQGEIRVINNLVGDLLFVNIPEATTTTVSTSTGRRVTKTKKQAFLPGTTGLINGGEGFDPFISGRLSWRQINNYQDLKTKP